MIANDGQKSKHVFVYPNEMSSWEGRTSVEGVGGVEGRSSVAGVVSAVALAASAIAMTACGPGPCSDFNPTSRPLAVGESTGIDVRIVGGGFETPDVAGHYWARDGSPAGLPEDGVLAGRATLVEAQFFEDGDISADVVRIDLGEIRRLRLRGPHRVWVTPRVRCC